MHLLAATAGSVEASDDPVDLAQSPADLVVLSAADTELAMLAEARGAMADPPGLRLASLAHLRHPMSVDLHVANCAARSRMVVARVLGGTGYWRYGVEQYSAHLAAAGVPFVALPGDDRPDPELLALSSVGEADWQRLWAYLVEGGPENAANFLAHARHMLDGAEAPPGPRPLLRAGVYWPGAGTHAGPQAARSAWTDGAPVVPLVFYRALVQGAGLQPINRLVKQLARAGMNPLPVFVASLKDPISVATLEALFAEMPPDVILNCTAFSVGTPDAGARAPENPLAGDAANGAPVLQVVLSGGTEAAWEEGLTGLSGRDIAMNVALPEVDGRLLTRAVSFKDQAWYDDATECPIASYRARGDRIAFVADLAAAWARLRRTPTAARQVALVLANYPNKDGRLANGVGLDTPAATVHVLRLLKAAGYGVTGAPEDGAALMAQVMAGPTNWLPDRAARTGGVRLSMAAYRDGYDALPLAVRERVEGQWGAPEDDPFAGPDGFALSVLRFGNVTVGLQPARGYNIDPEATYHSPDLVPPHNYLAFYLWLRRDAGRAGDRPHGQAREPGMAAGQGAGAVRGLLAGGGAGPDAACLSLHRQRSRRGHAGEASGAGSHRRPSDAAADPGRELRAAARPRGAGGRVLRGRRRRSAAHGASAARDPEPDGGHRARARTRA